MQKAFSIWKFNLISWLPPLVGAASADIVSPCTFGVRCFNKKSNLVLRHLFKRFGLSKKSPKSVETPLSWNSRLLAEQRVVLLVFDTPPAWNSTEKGVWALAGSIFIYVNSDERAMSRVNQDESAYVFFFLLLKSSFPFWNPQRIWCCFLYI